MKAPSFPIAVLLVIAPGLAVAQFRALAVAITVAFLLTIVAHLRAHRRLPWPEPVPMLGLALALLGWCAVSALWSSEGMRALQSTASLAALVVLGAMAARAVGEDSPAALRRLGPALVAGLAIGAALMAFDHASGNAFRLAVRGFPTDMPFIAFGLKPAVSFLALLLPLVLAAPGVAVLPRALLLGAGLALAAWLPGDAARYALVGGLVAAGVASLAPRLIARLAAVALAGFILLAPALIGAVTARGPDISGLPNSAAHRVLIWDFVTDRIAERPILGWGMEASRAMPEGTRPPGADTLTRFGLTSPEDRAWFSQSAVQRLPLHPHNASLQIWLELGAVGALLAACLAASVLLAGGASPAAVGVVASASVTGQLSFGVWQPWWIAALLLAVVVLRGFSAGREQPQQRR